LRALTIEPVGLGAVLVRLEQLRQRLAAEGLFAPERKRPLPFLPRRIGLVTGSEAAAKRDVIATIRKRFPPARVLVAEAYVQGPRAPQAIADALRAVCRAGVDVIVLARGGGSFDDLLPFSDEGVVRAVADCPVPVVSAVGHEQDAPLCDLAADVRASTPTAAAGLVVPDLAELQASLLALQTRANRARRARLEHARSSLEDMHRRLGRAPASSLERKTAVLAESRRRLRDGRDRLLERRASEIHALAGRLRALAPMATLSRGYAIARLRGHVISDTSSLTIGDRVDVELARGRFGARVDDVDP
jgi:exodeoxyribonuclease VII large subunit